jgi:hypothetical protein
VGRRALSQRFFFFAGAFVGAAAVGMKLPTVIQWLPFLFGLHPAFSSFTWMQFFRRQTFSRFFEQVAAYRLRPNSHRQPSARATTSSCEASA